MDGFWHISETQAHQSGVDYGNGSRSIRVVARKIEGEHLSYVVVKIPGGSHWAGRGMGSASHPGAYHVLQIIEEKQPGIYRCKDLMEFPLRN